MKNVFSKFLKTPIRISPAHLQVRNVKRQKDFTPYNDDNEYRTTCLNNHIVSIFSNRLCMSEGGVYIKVLSSVHV